MYELILCSFTGWADTEGLQEAMPDFHSSNKDALRSAQQGADTITFLASSDKSMETGKFWFDRQVYICIYLYIMCISIYNVFTPRCRSVGVLAGSEGAYAFWRHNRI